MKSRKKIKLNRGSAFLYKHSTKIYKNEKIEIEGIPTRLHTGTGAAEGAIQTLKNLIVANLEDNISFTENINLDLRVMRLNIHTGLKVNPIDTYHGRKPGTNSTKKSKIITVTCPTEKQPTFPYHRSKSHFT